MKSYTASIRAKIIYTKYITYQTYINNFNNDPILDSSVFSYLNPNDDFLLIDLFVYWPVSVFYVWHNLSIT